MSTETREEIASLYRIVSDPSWQVQRNCNGEWITSWYCRDEAGAKRMLEKTIQRAIDWSSLTDEERMASILRQPSTIHRTQDE